MTEFIMTIGLPASGKSTYAAEKAKEGYVHISSDAIRGELYGDEGIQGNPREVFDIMKKRALNEISKGNNVIYDATNVSRKDRRRILGQLPRDVYKTAVIFAIPIQDILDRNAARKRHVPVEVIYRMLQRFYVPTYKEFNSIVIKNNRYVSPIEYIEKNDIPHNNSHHKYDIKEHSNRVYSYVRERTSDIIVQLAAKYHDIGKYLVKSIDENGEAHYLNHANVGAYLYLTTETILSTEDRLRVAFLIETHMNPFNKAFKFDNFNKEWGEELTNALKLIHTADLREA